MIGSIWTILLEMPGQCIYSLYEILICLNACKAMIMIQDFLYCVISNINVARQTGVARKLILESAALLFLRNISIQVALRNIIRPKLGTSIKKGPRTKFMKQMLPCFSPKFYLHEEVQNMSNIFTEICCLAFPHCADDSAKYTYFTYFPINNLENIYGNCTKMQCTNI